MRLYHFLSKHWALDDIVRRRLKLSRIDGLNDPFELLSVALDDRDRRKVVDHWKKEMTQRYGLICFSRRSSNPVQWSHYAERHTGICLGFDVPENVAMPVRYVRHRDVPEILEHMLSDSEHAENLMKTVLATKYSHWRYEAEVRTFHRLEAAIDGQFFAEFGPDLILREVIVGALSNTTRAEVDNAIGALSGVTAYKKRLAFKTFSVVRNRDAKLWK